MDPPLRSPPPGVSSNFKDPPFLGQPVVAAAAISLPLVVVFVAIRIYARVAVVKKWKWDDYVYSLSCALGVAMIAFSLSIVYNGANGFHAWDVREDEVTKSSILGLLAFWIALGPMLWLLKMSLFSFVLSTFGSVRWLKNCVWAGIIVTGLFFSGYTIVVTMTCGPRPNSDARSYLSGLNRKECSSSSGANAIVSSINSVVNGVCNFYLLIITYPLVPSLQLHRKQMRGVYVMQLTGVIVCICSLLGIFYRIKSWRSTDLTGSQVPYYTAFVLEIAFSLIIPCMPSVWTVYRYFTVPDINDTTTIGTPSKLLSAISSPQTESRATWRKTHGDIEEIPYKKTPSEYSHITASDTPGRMKALPSTPLPLFTQPVPPSPQTPNTPESFRTMSLPIMFHHSSHR